MRAVRGRAFSPAIRSEGGLLPADLLGRIAANDPQVPGLTPEAYHLDRGVRLGEAITRSWNRLVGAWAAFRDELESLPPGDAAIRVTRERWLLPLFEELGYGRLQPARAVELEGRTYPVSHAWGAVPIHLVGARVDLDRRTTGVAGAARHAPHTLVQELLNRSPERLWGIVSNGRSLRLLRDNRSLTRQAYLEFDLEAIFGAEAYSDFALLWLVAHESRLEGERPEECWLERWVAFAASEGTRALDRLRDGVERAIVALGRGFLAHLANGPLRAALRDGSLDRTDYYRQLLRLVYRLLFLFTAEDRELLLDPAADRAAAERYARWYSTARLRQLAVRRRGSRHPDLWAMLRVVVGALGSDSGAPGLGLPALGGFLFGPGACPDLDRAELANADLLEAVRSLATIADGRVLRPIDYRNLGAEELGSVYESLLELHPDVNVEAATFSLSVAAGHERKTTGSYYTPASLVAALLDSALDPVLDEAARSPDPERAILSLRVVDPAAGSGHFLVAAAHRIAKRLAALRSGEEEPPPEALRSALRDVIGHCLYAVDVNPMAVELCKVSLWLEALEPGKPLSFLDGHVKCGNSLLGTTLELLAGGIPDGAYEPITGDDRTTAAELKRQNRREREGQLGLGEAGAEALVDPLVQAVRELEALPAEVIGEVHAKETRFRSLLEAEPYRRAKLVADAWCGAFVAPKRR
ncbi:MAG TPA: N-6 DNA methylase, partial [Candidatus Limnocylindrales bacterium]|nr:N-6 DNA methylase [Candidatus Limnocylindrales bacterium]